MNPTKSVATTMRPTTMRAAVICCLLLLAACNRNDLEDRTEAVKSAAAATPTAVASTETCSSLAALGELDERQPVPLQPMMAWHQKQNMMEHLVAIQRITGGVAEQDWEEVASAAALIESSPQMQKMCEHMGSGASGFTEMALEFHRRADAIGPAARAHDGPAVLRATSHTLKSCTGCHGVYRQEVVNLATWQERTGSTHDPTQGHMDHMQ